VNTLDVRMVTSIAELCFVLNDGMLTKSTMYGLLPWLHVTEVRCISLTQAGISGGQFDGNTPFGHWCQMLVPPGSSALLALKIGMHRLSDSKYPPALPGDTYSSIFGYGYERRKKSRKKVESFVCRIVLGDGETLCHPVRRTVESLLENCCLTAQKNLRVPLPLYAVKQFLR